MSVIGGFQPKRRHNRLQPGNVSWQVFWPNGGILYSGDGFGVTFAASEKRKSSLSHRPYEVRFCLVFDYRCSQPKFSFLQCGQTLRHVFEELDGQNRLARFVIEFQQIASALKFELALSLVEQNPIDVFDGRRL